MARPLCRYCGKPIPKRTTTVWFEETQEDVDRKAPTATFYRYLVGSPMTKEDAQSLVNETIVHITRGAFRNGRFDKAYIGRASTWDGTSYTDDHFCKRECAEDFGHIVARDRPELATAAYNAALKKQKAKP
jgi:hypothetical protein